MPCRLVDDLHSPLAEQFLDVSEAERNAIEEPDVPANDVSGESVAPA
jgi:hypothetical protein